MQWPGKWQFAGEPVQLIPVSRTALVHDNQHGGRRESVKRPASRSPEHTRIGRHVHSLRRGGRPDASDWSDFLSFPNTVDTGPAV
jgi:hypothetical protein